MIFALLYHMILHDKPGTCTLIAFNGDRDISMPGGHYLKGII